MDSKIVDEFFNDGSLMLSSFNRFAAHKDEQRSDESEGKGVRVLTGSEFTAMMATGRGHDCYILCGSTVNTKAVRGCFPDADACLVIDSPVEFAGVISWSVPAFKGGASGHCIYQDEATIRRHSDSFTLENSLPKTLDDIRDLAELAGGIEELFVKRAQFAAQAEYRWAWASAAQMEEFIVVKCPDARQFCRRL